MNPLVCIFSIIKKNGIKLGTKDLWYVCLALTHNIDLLANNWEEQQIRELQILSSKILLKNIFLKKIQYQNYPKTPRSR